ncbi:MAG TPA: aminoacyl--tRNA ligase-related protein [Bryobacteraceae bacterium]|nr:aminoacyl--tRNA ligase-related protein [Bryobacteraceae bacterium]
MTAQAELQSAIPDELIDEFLKRIPYLSEGIGNVRLLPGASRVAFDLQPGFEGQAEVVASRISDVAGKLCLNYRPGSTRTLARQDMLAGTLRDDPHPLLLERGEIVQFGRGRYGFGPKLVRLMEYFDVEVRQMATQFQAEPHTFPSLVGADVLDACRYLKNFPSSLNLVSHLREDHAVLQEFARGVRWDGQQLAYDRNAGSGVECLLSPSVCFHWYRWLRDARLEKPRAITALGKCFRYESSNLTGLERLWDFTMREIVFVGSSDYVLQNRNMLVEFSARFLDELGLAYQISTATDPFFVDSYAVQAAYQQGFELKFELLAPLPYSGRNLAVGSINYHQDFFGRSFGIQYDGAPAHTGCIGFGYERLALAFLAQHGVDEANWPAAVARAIPDGGGLA